MKNSIPEIRPDFDDNIDDVAQYICTRAGITLPKMAKILRPHLSSQSAYAIIWRDITQGTMSLKDHIITANYTGQQEEFAYAVLEQLGFELPELVRKEEQKSAKNSDIVDLTKAQAQMIGLSIKMLKILKNISNDQELEEIQKAENEIKNFVTD